MAQVSVLCSVVALYQFIGANLEGPIYHSMEPRRFPCGSVRGEPSGPRSTTRYKVGSFGGANHSSSLRGAAFLRFVNLRLEFSSLEDHSIIIVVVLFTTMMLFSSPKLFACFFVTLVTVRGYYPLTLVFQTNCEDQCQSTPTDQD